MSVQLLDKTRKINKLLHNNNSSKVVFNDICAVLTEILDSNVLVVSRKGKILGVSKCLQVREIHELITESVGSHIDAMLNERLLSILSTKENVNLETLGFSPESVGAVRRSSLRSILQANGLERFSFTSRIPAIRSTISFSQRIRDCGCRPGDAPLRK